MIFFSIISFLIIQTNSFPESIKKNVRSGRIMRFNNADDIFSDVFDEMQDPLSIADLANSNRLKGSKPQYGTGYQFKTKNFTNGNPDPTNAKEKFALYNQNTGKFELITSTSGHFMLPVRSVTENDIIYYDGEHYRYRKPVFDDSDTNNKTGEVKVFWSSVTDAIQNLPFLPLQINVPDMINAMANFLTTSIPIINRFTNPNNPRLPSVKYQITNSLNSTIVDPLKNHNYEEVTLHDDMEEREIKNWMSSNERKPNKKRKFQRRKNSKSKRKNPKGSTKGILQRPVFRRTTELPADDIKIWHQYSNPVPNTIKNIPITRKKFNVRDRETFNFKHSDISNSPIMILNIPSRPMVYYKTKVKQNIEEEKNDSIEKNVIQKVNSSFNDSKYGMKNFKNETSAEPKKTITKKVNFAKQKGSTTENSMIR